MVCGLKHIMLYVWAEHHLVKVKEKGQGLE